MLTVSILKRAVFPRTKGAPLRRRAVIDRALLCWREWRPQPPTRLREKLIMIGAKAVSDAVRRRLWLFSPDRLTMKCDPFAALSRSLAKRSDRPIYHKDDKSIT